VNSPAPSAGVQERAAAMLNRELVAVLATPRAGAQVLPLLDRHFDYMIGLEQRGLLFLSGPLRAPSQAAGLGLTILNVADIEAARALWDGEPFHAAGLRDAQFFIWNVMEGSLQFTLQLSAQRVALGQQPPLASAIERSTS
jgi:uncharacterized protein YciI